MGLLVSPVLRQRFDHLLIMTLPHQMEAMVARSTTTQLLARLAFPVAHHHQLQHYRLRRLPLVNAMIDHPQHLQPSVTASGKMTRKIWECRRSNRMKRAAHDWMMRAVVVHRHQTRCPLLHVQSMSQDSSTRLTILPSWLTTSSLSHQCRAFISHLQDLVHQLTSVHNTLLQLSHHKRLSQRPGRWTLTKTTMTVATRKGRRARSLLKASATAPELLSMVLQLLLPAMAVLQQMVSRSPPSRRST